MNFSQKIKLFSILVIVVICAYGMFVFWFDRTHHRRQSNVLPRPEINITIIPGWNLRQIADDWVKKGLIKDRQELYVLAGEPMKEHGPDGPGAPRFDWLDFWKNGSSTLPVLFLGMPRDVSYEGYFLPDTYRVYADAKPEEVIKKIFNVLNDRIAPEMRRDIKKQNKGFYEILTMASVVEKEAPKGEMAKIADIFWRRNKMNWALQSCATVNYITGKNDPAVSAKDKQIDSRYNTYKYPGLPWGPISNPSMVAIKAVIYPEKNDYWYFMSDADGGMHYARTLEEHNANVAKYLR